MKIRNVVIISDTHFGCQFGLCPETVSLDGGGTYHSSVFQKEVFSKWEEFWTKWVPQVTRNEDFVVVHNGDVIDGTHHGSVTQISQNITDQQTLATEVLSEIVKLKHCADYYQIRGTEAHVGQSAQYEEKIAKSLKAVKDEFGNYSRFEMWLRIDSKLIHFSHHVGTTSSAAYESTAVYKELVEAYNEAGRWKDEPPDGVVRSHRHRAFKIEVPSDKGNAIAIVTPGWQLKTPFSHRIALGRSATPQIGGYLLRIGAEEPLYSRSKVWRMPRSMEVII